LQTILHPVPVERKCSLNGAEFDPEELAKRER